MKGMRRNPNTASSLRPSPDGPHLEPIAKRRQLNKQAAGGCRSIEHSCSYTLVEEDNAFKLFALV